MLEQREDHYKVSSFKIAAGNNPVIQTLTINVRRGTGGRHAHF